MQLYKPKFKESEIKIYESLNRQFLDSFRNVPEHEMNPKRAWETCDLHLDGRQKILFATPKKEGAGEVTWQEPKDQRDMWERHINLYWGIISFISFIFFMIIFYMWF